MNEHLHETASDEWSSCPRGELAALQSRLRSTNRRKRLRVAGASAVVAFALIAAVWVSMDMPWSLPLRRTVAGIDCPTCKQRLPDYERGALSAEQAQQVRDHLAGCEWCCWYRDRYYGGAVGDEGHAGLRRREYVWWTPRFVLGEKLARLIPGATVGEGNAAATIYHAPVHRAPRRSSEPCPCCDGASHAKPNGR